MGTPSSKNTAPSVPGLGEDDYYFEGENLVFTAVYHLKRGYCCGSGCRHCPYEHRNVPGVEAADQGADAPEDADAPDAA
jgi:hypothetical protein